MVLYTREQRPNLDKLSTNFEKLLAKSQKVGNDTKIVEFDWSDPDCKY